MTFELREHTADVAVAAHGPTLGDAFAETANGLAAAMCEEIPASGDRFAIAVEAESREALLFDYLDDLIYQRDVRNVLPVENEAAVTSSDGRWELSGQARGVPLSAIAAREIKAVTYSEMRIAPDEDGWSIYVVFDV